MIWCSASERFSLWKPWYTAYGPPDPGWNPRDGLYEVFEERLRYGLEERA